MDLQWLNELTGWGRVLAVVVLAVAAHILVRLIERAAEWTMQPKGKTREDFFRTFPKAASVITITVSTITFVVYFGALGMILVEFGVNPTAYVASATVIGLAVGFGSQGLVQDVVGGLTLIFSDVLDVGDMVEVAGHTGRVHRIGLRFTTLVNFHGQSVFIPNRNIAIIGRFRGGFVRAYVDVQVPTDLTEERVTALVTSVAGGVQNQFRAALPVEPEVFGIRSIDSGSPAPSAGGSDPGSWRFVRIKFRLWPGQTQVVETYFRQRLLAALRSESSEYPDWMIMTTYRAA